MTGLLFRTAGSSGCAMRLPVWHPLLLSGKGALPRKLYLSGGIVRFVFSALNRILSFPDREDSK